MTLAALRRRGEALLLSAAVPDAAYDARELLLFAAQIDVQGYARSLDTTADAALCARYEELLSRRAAREPLQYILGEAPFFGRDFYVTKDVLIPRFDSEVLVSAVLAHLSEDMRLLDLCTGSGCLLLTVLLESGLTLHGTGSDISEAALAIARKNAGRYACPASFLQADVYEGIPDKYDIIMSNPPYIRAGDLALLDAEVRDFEPRLALDGGEDGLCFYRKIIEESPAHLVLGGRLFLEIGADEGAAVSQLLAANGFLQIEIIKDLAGHDRVVSGVYAEHG